MGEPVVQYFGVDESDGKGGRPIVDACNGIPVYRNLVFHDGRKASQEHRQQELLIFQPFADMQLYPAVCFLQLQFKQYFCQLCHDVAEVEESLVSVQG